MSEPSFQLPTHISLTLCGSGDIQTSEIIRLHRATGRDLIDDVWWNEIDGPIADPKNEPDDRWRWRDIVSYYQNKPSYKAVALQTEDGQVQAAMIYRVGFKSQLEESKFSVYVDRLATAPRNRPNLVKEPVFRGGGTGLLVFAAAQSYFLGQEGRISLVPIANLDWYQSRGFVQTDTEIPDGRIYELPKERAIALLIEKGLLNE